MKKIAINGFGRIGRAAFKIALTKRDIDVVVINDLTDTKTLAHLLQYDTVYGEFDQKVLATKDGIKVGGVLFPVYQEKDPTKLPWKKLDVDVVLECTGFFTDKKGASGHLTAGAKRVVISAPAKDGTVQTIVFGTKYTDTCIKNNKCDEVVSMASCTTNCISPIIQALESKFGVEKAMMTTVHSYTSSQKIVDSPDKDLRRARAGAQNIIPTSTGAAMTTTKTIPSLKDLFDGIALRVPTICGSIADITAVLKRKNVTVKQINDEFKNLAKNPLYKKVLTVTTKPLVSSDYIGNPYSAIVDLEFTRVVGGNLVKVLAWYDNEWGYSNRLVEMAQSLAM
ncbi:MAG TPA: type I glyceraldehyde-3-phosphate dehydrogenase [Patescibacteria group bacterium]|nr:type I glyceraldehyde-3-phosphate dehydrogenase [Patescibacteria group bacterium]